MVKKFLEGIFGNHWMNYWTDVHIDIVLIMYIFWAKIFFKGWGEKIVKNGDVQVLHNRLVRLIMDM